MIVDVDTMPIDQVLKASAGVGAGAGYEAGGFLGGLVKAQQGRGAVKWYIHCPELE